MPVTSSARPARWFWPCLALVALLFCVQGIRLAYSLLTWSDESSYLHLGYLATNGTISLFQDEMLGSRMPLPFYVLGLSQLPCGRSLLAARLVSLALGVVALMLIALIGRRLAGDLAGLLAALFLATQGVLVGYFATAQYHSLSAVLFLGGLAVILFVPRPAGTVLGMAVISLLFLVRTNLWPIVPGVAALLFATARDARERILVALASVAVPVAFFVWDPRHLKVLAYVPLLGRWMEALGYRSTLALTAFPTAYADRVGAAIRFARTYEFWALAAVILAGLLLWGRRRGDAWPALMRNRPVVLLAGLLGYVFVSQVAVFWHMLKPFVAYFPSWAPLVPLLLGVGFAAVLTRTMLSRTERTVVVGVLAVLLVAPTIIVRHPINPPPGVSAIEDLGRAASHLARLIPSGAHVFLLGHSMPLYLADRDPYLRQIHSTETLAAVEDRDGIERHGLWGLAEIEEWLARDAQYAVVQPALVEHYRPSRPRQIERLEALLAEHFVRLDRVDDYRPFVFDVYGRRSLAHAPESPRTSAR